MASEFPQSLQSQIEEVLAHSARADGERVPERPIRSLDAIASRLAYTRPTPLSQMVWGQRDPGVPSLSVDILAQASALSAAMRGLAREVTELRDSILAAAENQSASVPFPMVLTALRTTDDFRLLRDVPLTIQEMEGEYSATWVEVELTGLGQSVHEAIVNFENQLTDLFDELSVPADKLGPLPQAWKRTLEQAIERVRATAD